MNEARPAPALILPARSSPWRSHPSSSLITDYESEHEQPLPLSLDSSFSHDTLPSQALRERTKAAVIEAGGMDSLLGFVGVDMAGALRYLLQSSATLPRARGARAYATQLSLLALGAPEVVHDVSQALVGAVVAALAEQSHAALRVRSALSSQTDSAEQPPRQVSDEVERERFLQVPGLS